LNTYTYPVDVSANAVFLEWDVFSVDVGNFSNATLYLYVDSFGGDLDYDLSIYGVEGVEVDASTVTWDFPWSVGGGMS